MKSIGWRIAVVAEASSESAKRGLALLREHAGDALRIDIVETTRKDLVSRFREQIFDPEMKELRDPPLSLVLADFDFTHRAADLRDLEALAGMAAGLQAPLVTAAGPGFFDLKQISLLPKLPDLPQRLSDPAHAGWQKFQKRDEARWVVLTVNRYLQEAPPESAEPPKPDTLAWGRGIWIVGAAVARSVREQGHALDLSGNRAGRFAGMPVRPYPKLANQTVSLATETAIPEQQSLELSRLGFVALAGQMGGDAVIVPLAVNVHRTAPGRLTVSGTLGYQIALSRLAQLCAFLLPELPAGADAAAAALKREITEFLGPLAGPDPDAAVQVVPQEVKDGNGKPLTIVEITVLPAAKLETMDLRFTFQVPLAGGG